MDFAYSTSSTSLVFITILQNLGVSLAYPSGTVKQAPRRELTAETEDEGLGDIYALKRYTTKVFTDEEVAQNEKARKKALAEKIQQLQSSKKPVGVGWTAHWVECEGTFDFDAARKNNTLSSVVLGKQYEKYFDEIEKIDPKIYSISVQATSQQNKLRLSYYEEVKLTDIQKKGVYAKVDIPTADQPEELMKYKEIYTGLGAKERMKKMSKPSYKRALEMISRRIDRKCLKEQEIVDYPRECAYLDANTNMKFSVETETYERYIEGKRILRLRVKLSKGKFWMGLRELDKNLFEVPSRAEEAFSNIKQMLVYYWYEGMCLAQIILPKDTPVLPQVNLARNALRVGPTDDAPVIPVDGSCAYTVKNKMRSFFNVQIHPVNKTILLTIQLMLKNESGGLSENWTNLRKCDYINKLYKADTEADQLAKKVIELSKKGMTLEEWQFSQMTPKDKKRKIKADKDKLEKKEIEDKEKERNKKKEALEKKHAEDKMKRLEEQHKNKKKPK